MYNRSICKERATRKNSQLAAAQGVALKLGGGLGCSSVRYRSGYVSSYRSPPRTALSAAHFERNDISQPLVLLTPEINVTCFAPFRGAPMAAGLLVEFDRMEAESTRRRRGGDREPV